MCVCTRVSCTERDYTVIHFVLQMCVCTRVSCTERDYSYKLCITDVCVYKGVMYRTGQKWQDGCDYECVCSDGVTGHYECTDKYVYFVVYNTRGTV